MFYLIGFSHLGSIELSLYEKDNKTKELSFLKPDQTHLVMQVDDKI